ncbi:MAG: T9SS type A sorting domain-containing protein [Bacteroidales bacterium]|nr:T9SS type A sorting domain-containing protein [Bacteroidales bacterium]
MKNVKFYIASLILLTCITSSKAQETITGLQTNPTIKQLYSNNSRTKTVQTKALLELPFIDDFAKTIGFTDELLWQDKNVFVNQTYAFDQLSIGVATFDAIDETGAIHSNASILPFSADTLTSNIINLNYPGNNTIFLSFYYQPGGLGDTPDIKDSLILEFCYSDTVWNKKWSVIFNETDSILSEKHFYADTTNKTINGDTITDLKRVFQQVLIPVNEAQYLTDSFQFRFRNYASLSGNESAESKASNADHWHIDYVILDKDRSINDTFIVDIAICEPMGSLLKNYEAIPWKHFDRASAYEMGDTIQITFRNLTDTIVNPKKTFEIEDLLGFTGTTPFERTQEPEMQPQTKYTYERSIDYLFPYNPSIDSALFEIRSFFDENDIEEAPFQWNDTSRFLQKFYNYYAYDDGTAESGYGIIGEGTENAMVAMRYNTYKKDTLRAVQIFFNQTLGDVNQYSFKLHVWKDDNGKPGKIIYTKEGLKPQKEDEINKFATYIIDSTLVLEGNFYIGWQKVNTPEMLNVGFDVNKINNDKLFYRFSNSWVQSKFEGTIMIRPLFGEELNFSTSTNTTTLENHSPDYTIYPNPANDQLNINIDDQFTTDYRYTIFDIYGRIFIDSNENQSNIDISGLNSGVYFIRISNPYGANTTKKFMIVR